MYDNLYRTNHFQNGKKGHEHEGPGSALGDISFGSVGQRGLHLSVLDAVYLREARFLCVVVVVGRESGWGVWAVECWSVAYAARHAVVR